MNKQLISSGTKWETLYGYSRAVKVGNVIAVSGTTAVDEASNIVGENDLYAQTVFIYQKIEKALQQAGATLNDIVRLRIFITDMSRYEEVLKAQGEFFANIRPAATIVEVTALIDKKLLVEIEADAVLE
ncbi:RidA family protein [Ilyomonas limi]|uniref:RidA family protein n=1 Tax=Ilyomonas limi TaxID=2575867 RepID=A0A4U3L987_9BACT|nr:RidA family protein [Ilyomonas limi]TKK71945.1 RidA family protein [Ilyomonas limi]